MSRWDVAAALVTAASLAFAAAQRVWVRRAERAARRSLRACTRWARELDEREAVILGYEDREVAR